MCEGRAVSVSPIQEAAETSVPSSTSHHELSAFSVITITPRGLHKSASLLPPDLVATDAVDDTSRRRDPAPARHPS